MRRLPMVIIVALLAAGLTGCGRGPDAASDQVRSWVKSAGAGPYHLVYTEDLHDRHTVVEATVYDDYAYDAMVRVDGRLVAEEKARYDALAVRADASSFPATSRWLLDPTGAPDLTSLARDSIPDTDPVLKALAALTSAVDAIDAAATVTTYNPEALDYRPADDLFPHPDKQSKQRRYDLRAPKLPTQGTRDLGAAPPEPKNFRRMSVYVHGGQVLRILEKVTLAGDLPALDRAYGLHLERDGATEDQALAVVNDLRRKRALAPLVLRSVSLEITRLPEREPPPLPTPTVLVARLPLTHPWAGALGVPAK